MNQRPEDYSDSIQHTGSERVSSIRDAFEQAWRGDQRPAIVEYLSGAEDESQRSVLLRELLLVELEYRTKAGETPLADEYLDRFPDRAEVVREVFSWHGSSETVDFSRTPNESTQDHRVGRGLPAATLPEGKRFGDYVLLEEIAHGGMGVVYKAHQEGLNRTVALKMILAGELADEEHVRRFQSEAEAAATLDHPNIVPVYEVGQHEGQHYFSMGYVAGESLKAAVAEGPLAPRLAAQLVQTIAEAVEYAHGQGIVHRDLKPANVLLDENGVPKVADFGLAKRIDRDSSMTATGQAMGTPSYMPPEQAAARTDEIGPCSDIYSLGALLYCLLTGRPPFQGANVVETLRQVAEREPVSPRELNPEVDRDLETICLKCLQKQPEARYQSATDLADELGRFLEGRPILARPVSRPARLWRWSKRNPVLATVSAAALVLMSTLAVGGPLAAFEQSRLRGIADDEKERADVEAEKADAEADKATAERDNAHDELKEHQQTLLAYVDTVGDAELLKDPRFAPLKGELLKDALAHYQRFLARHRDDPEWAPYVAQAMFRVASIISETLGASKEDALTAYQESLAVYEGLVREDPTDRQYQGQLALVHNNIGILHGDTGRPAEALAAYQQAVDIGELLTRENATVTEYQYNLASSHNNIGVLYIKTGKPTEALAAYQKALEIEDRLARENPTVTEYQDALAGSHDNIGMLYKNTGRPAEALAAYQHALEIRDRLAREHPTVTEHQNGLAASHNKTGLLYSRTGKPAEALAAYQKALAIRGRLAHENPTVTKYQSGLAASYVNIGSLYTLTGKPTEALSAQLKGLEIFERLVRGDPTVTEHQSSLAKTHNKIGLLYTRIGKPAEAFTSHLKAVEVFEHLARENPTNTEYQYGLLTNHNDIGPLYIMTGKPAEALAACQEALKIGIRLTRENPTVTDYQSALAASHSNIGLLYLATGKPAEALAAWKQALEIRERLVRENPTVTEYAMSLASSLVIMADLNERAVDPETALASSGRAISILRDVLKREPRNIIARRVMKDTYLVRAEIYEGMKNDQAATVDRNKAAELDVQSPRSEPRFSRIMSLARGGEYQDAILQADELAETVKQPGAIYELAGVYSVCASAASKDTEYNETLRELFADAYAEKSLALLKRAAEAGFFQDGQNRKRLTTDKDLAALRDREDFQEFLKSLDE